MLRSLKAFYFVTAGGGCFLFFWSGSLLLSWIVLPLVHWSMRGRPEIDRVHACQDVIGLGFRLFLATMRWTRTLVFRPADATLAPPDEPCVFIANHPTLIDVTAIMAVHPRVCCVAKSVLFDSVMVGPLLRRCGHINGGGDDLSSGASVILQATERLKQGQSVLIFPEGTRSPAHGLRRFRPGAFEICRRAGAPAMPILISCDPPTLLKGLAWYALPRKTAHYSIRQFPTLKKETLEGDSHQTAREIQAFYQEQVDALSEKSETGSPDVSIPLGEDVDHARP